MRAAVAVACVLCLLLPGRQCETAGGFGAAVSRSDCPAQELGPASKGSRSWVDKDESKHLHLLIVARPWTPFAHVTVRWPEDTVSIESVVGASVISTTGSWIELELDGQLPSARYVQVEATGTLDHQPLVACSASHSPPPTPPHPEDCSLGAAYQLIRNWGTGAIVQVSLEVWQDGKTFTLTFYDQDIKVDKKSLANVVLDEVSADTGGNTVAKL
eukprot:536510-Prymnesium_polylepis.1